MVAALRVLVGASLVLAAAAWPHTITRENVKNLRVAWLHSHGENAATLA